MKILFTGASSFTGYWFAKELTVAGHEVVAVFRRQLGEYPDDLRRKRIKRLSQDCHSVFGVCFGDDRFLELIKGRDWDLVCHHGAEAADYKNPDFDVIAAVKSNANRLPVVLDLLISSGCSKLVLTGSVFENDEGVGSMPLDAFSPYGLSKGVTWQFFRYYTQSRRMSLGKFVIPNPFGPYEEPRFTHYLFQNWFAGQTAVVNTPSYIRDNIHVSLLAKVYSNFVTKLADGTSRINPSGYVESQGAFAHRVANEMKERLGLNCGLLLKEQNDFSEPRIRINSDTAGNEISGWSEKDAWDELADYYEQLRRRVER